MIGTFDIGLAKLATDIGLGLALLFLGTRIKKPSLAPQALGKLRALEQSIKNLLGEAEQASVGLTEDLLKRRKELETTLEEVKEAEKKLARDMVEAEEKSKALLANIRESERNANLSKQMQPAATRQAPLAPRQAPRQPLSEQVEQYSEQAEESYSELGDAQYDEYGYENPAPAQHRARTPARPQRQTAPQQKMQYQQKGFDQEPASFGQQNRQGLAGQIQTQNTQSADFERMQNRASSQNYPGAQTQQSRSQQQNAVRSPLNTIEQAAENTAQSTLALHAEAIKAALMKRKAEAARGQQANQYKQSAASSGNYPLPEAYSEERKQGETRQASPSAFPEEIAVRENDARLGVLSGIRRHTQVV